MPSNQIGVYLIRNTKTGRIYIGSTSKSLSRRWKEHRRLLNAGEHSNRRLQRAWDKHGPAAFSFEVIEVICTESLVLEREQYWLDSYHNYPCGIYNVAMVAGAPMKGRKHSARTRDKLGKPYPAFINNSTGEVIQAGINLARMCKGRGLSQAGMYLVMTGKALSCCGWRLVQPLLRTGKRSRRSGIDYQPLVNMDTGEIIPAGTNLTGLCRERNFPVRIMHRVVSGKTYSCKGWRLASGERKNMQHVGKSYPTMVNLNTGEVLPAGSRISLFCDERGMDISSMRKVINGRRRSYKGWAIAPTD